MNNRSCHRCSMKFNSCNRLVMHLLKEKKCTITNLKYDENYEKLIVSELNNIKTNLDSDAQVYIIKESKYFKCTLCDYKLNNRYHIKRHLMYGCLKEKYKPKKSLIQLLSYKQPLVLSERLKDNILNTFVPYIKIIKDALNNYIYECLICGLKYDDKYNIYGHIEEKHQNCINNVGNISKHIDLAIDAKLKDVHSKIIDMKSEMKNIKPMVHNNNLHIYLKDNGDALKLLEEKFGDFPRALEFIKNCALSHISGDVRLIEHLYLETNQPAVFFFNKKKQKLAWIDEYGLIHFDDKSVVGRKLANNLQNGYLNGANYLTDKSKTDGPLLEDYDINAWNDHIYLLNDVKYQLKLFKHLDIPIKKLPQSKKVYDTEDF